MAAQVLFTGTTGNGRPVGRLVAGGCRVRCISRRPDALAGVAVSNVEVVAGNLVEVESLTVALASVRAAYYRAHTPHDGRNGPIW